MKCLRFTLHAILPLVILAGRAELAATETIVNYASGETIPDDDTTGLADTRAVASPITSVTEVQVRLNIAGGWNGDLFATLLHDSGYCVLLNRTGRDEFSDAGSDLAGYGITLSDDAVQDVHLSGGLLTITGTFQPDARTADPLEALGSSPRTAFLGNFQGLPASGEWTLFLADTSGGNVSTLVSWGLTLRGTVSDPRGLFDAWAAGLTGPNADVGASPQGDGLKNLLKYAFNLNPLTADARHLVFGATGETAGLPVHRVVMDGGTTTLEVEYLRNIQSGLIYTPQYSVDLEAGSFQPMTGPESVVTIDACWQRVRVQQTFPAGTVPRVFANVKVALP